MKSRERKKNNGDLYEISWDLTYYLIDFKKKNFFNKIFHRFCKERNLRTFYKDQLLKYFLFKIFWRKCNIRPRIMRSLKDLLKFSFTRSHSSWDLKRRLLQYLQKRSLTKIWFLRCIDKRFISLIKNLLFVFIPSSEILRYNLE